MHFQYFLPTKTQARLGSLEPFSQNENDHSIWIQHENDKRNKAITHTYKEKKTIK